MSPPTIRVHMCHTATSWAGLLVNRRQHQPNKGGGGSIMRQIYLYTDKMDQSKTRSIFEFSKKIMTKVQNYALAFALTALPFLFEALHISEAVDYVAEGVYLRPGTWIIGNALPWISQTLAGENPSHYTCRSLLTRSKPTIDSSPDFICMKASVFEHAPFSFVNMPTMFGHGSTKLVLFHQALIPQLLSQKSRIMVNWVKQVYGETHVPAFLEALHNLATTESTTRDQFISRGLVTPADAMTALEKKQLLNAYDDAAAQGKKPQVYQTEPQSIHAHTEAAQVLLERPGMGDAIIGVIATAIADVATVSCGDALHMKDNMKVSDKAYVENLATSNVNQPVNMPNMPRIWAVKEMRKRTDNVIVDHFGIGYDKSMDSEPCWLDLNSAVKMIVFDSFTREENGGLGSNLEVATVSLELTMDGSFAGKGKDFLSAGLVRMYGDEKCQSEHSIHPLGLALCGESSKSLIDLVPGLTDQVMELNTAGLQLDPVFNVPTGILRVNIEVAADLSTIWKLNGIGSAATPKSCIYCHQTQTGRQTIGADICDIRQPGNLRDDLTPVFGLKGLQIHFCSLHAHMSKSDFIVVSISGTELKVPVIGCSD